MCTVTEEYTYLGVARLDSLVVESAAHLPVLVVLEVEDVSRPDLRQGVADLGLRTSVHLGSSRER